MKVLFIDRDGTLIEEPPGGYVDTIEKLKILPNVIPSLQRLIKSGYKLVIISNQPGRGTDKFPEDHFISPQKKLMKIFAENNISFGGTFFCPHFREDKCNCMKPKTGLIDEFLKNNNIDLAKSYTIGDRETDILLAKNIGCKSIFYSASNYDHSVFHSVDWRKITDFILSRNK